MVASQGVSTKIKEIVCSGGQSDTQEDAKRKTLEEDGKILKYHKQLRTRERSGRAAFIDGVY